MMNQLIQLKEVTKMDKGIVYKFFPNLVNGKYYIKQRTIKNGVKKHSNMPNLVFDNKKDAKTKCEELEKSWNRFDVTGRYKTKKINLSKSCHTYYRRRTNRNDYS